MNDCIALYEVIESDAEFGRALGRVGSHSLGTHFGTIRLYLRGLTDILSWLSAEAYGRLSQEFILDLGLKKKPRRTRWVGGCDIVAASDETDDMIDA
jgi:hypothetical protein